VDDLVVDAAALARRHLDVPELADRWRHVRAVARRAAELTPAVPAADRGLIVAAAWLHDIGYAPDLVATGMHAIDGARYLLRCGYPPRLAALVAHHSGARFEATERNLVRDLDDFPLETSPAADALATADLTTGPQGQPMTFPQRLEEILRRYPDSSPVHTAMRHARVTLAAQVERTSDRLTSATGSP
jgi:putative nucleotidyltransferase with HDIG domain